jgi:hypothetical protein
MFGFPNSLSFRAVMSCPTFLVPYILSFTKFSCDCSLLLVRTVMADTNDSAFDIEEDGADAMVADFIVNALDQVDGTQGFEEEARLYQQQLHSAPVV